MRIQRLLDPLRTAHHTGCVAVAESSERRQSGIVEISVLDRLALGQFYRTVLEPSVPRAELVTLDEICCAYLGEDAQPGAVMLAEGEPVAGLLGEIYPASGVLLIAYLVVRGSQRGRGRGTALLAETLATWQASLRPSLVLAEIDDPRFHAADADKGDPVARARFYDRTGARLLAMPYFQPSLRLGSPRVYDMLLICYGDGDSVPSETVITFLSEYFEACEGVQVLTNPEFQKLLNYARRDTEGIPLWSLDRYPDVTRFTTAFPQVKEN
jgi:GNAT superfamily N-acetyltransferase